MNMELSDQQKEFLEGVEPYSTQFNAIRVKESAESLTHCFWGADAIEKAQEVKLEWDIPKHFIPFYGDWHDLFCLNLRTNVIVMLDDDRQVVHQWENIEVFRASLHSISEKPSGDRAVIKGKSWLGF